MGEPERIVDLKERLGCLEDLHPAVQLAKMAKELAWRARRRFNPDNLVFCASPDEEEGTVGLRLGYPTEPGEYLVSEEFIFGRDGGLGFRTGDGRPGQLSTAIEVFLNRIEYWHQSHDETL